MAEPNDIVGKVFFAYMKKILYRTSRDYISSERRRQTRFIFMDDVSPQELEVHLGDDSFSIWTKSNYHIHLQDPSVAEIIQDLSKRDREVLYYLFYEEITTKEAAELLGVSQQAIAKNKQKLLGRLNNGL